MIQNNARRAMAAAAGGSHITQIESVSAQVTDPQTWWETDQYGEISGSTTPNRLTASATNSTGWSFSVYAYDSSIATKWGFNSLSDLNNGNAEVVASDFISVYAEYSGVAQLPQATTLTLRNATYGNEIVWQITVTVNPEPV